MGRRLALLCDTDHESPWTHANGSEAAVVVKGLGEGEKVWVKVDLKPKGELLLFFAEGSTPLLPFNPLEWLRYKVGKIGKCMQLTTVEVHLGNG